MSQLLKSFVEFAKKEYGCEVYVDESKEASTFEEIFGESGLCMCQQEELSYNFIVMQLGRVYQEDEFYIEYDPLQSCVA